MRSKTAVLLGSLIFALLLAGCTENMSSDALDGDTVDGESRAVFAVTDDPLTDGNIERVNVTIDRVRVHREGDGWITVSTETREYDLLELKASDTQKVLADVNLPNGTYTKVWLDVADVVVVDVNGTHEAMLPSNTLKMESTFTVAANETAAATFDFQAGDSLHVTGNGRHVMTPVVQVETRENAAVDIDTDDHVQVHAGTVRTEVEVGMHPNGTVSNGVKIPSDANISVTAGDDVKVEIGGCPDEISVEAGDVGVYIGSSDCPGNGSGDNSSDGNGDGGVGDLY